MALAPVAYCLWQRFLCFNPENPIWENRDRFVLSAGHASMLLYSLLHLAEVKAVNSEYEQVGDVSVSLDDIKKFRQLDSKCPGHPEYRWTSGVETTTGPLGQGVATSVGMAIAEKWLAANYNTAEFQIFDYNIYALCGDGCLMEGVSHEAASLAGHLKLSNLCWIYDNNRITIEGSTALAFSEDVATRFVAYGWNIVRIGDANDLEMLERGFRTFQNTNDRPTLIIVDSHIGYGSPNKQDSHSAHGEPLGEEEIALTKKAYGWNYEEKFFVPEEVRENFRNGIRRRGAESERGWQATFERYKEQFPEKALQIEQMKNRALPEGWNKDLPEFPPDAKGASGRDASARVLNVIAQDHPFLVGGSADLAPSTKTRLTFDGAGDFSSENYVGRNFHFGIREHLMAAVLNGLSLSKIRPFGSGFLIFSDYARPSIRLSALMELPVIHIFTHDSIGVGEDGPTHQPIEQLASLRSVPGLIVLRPGDANEITEAWRLIMQLRHEPVALILSRQAMPTLDRNLFAPASGLQKGAYVLADPEGGEPEVILIGSGSEVSLCIKVFKLLGNEGIKSRVVSIPSWEIFEQQTPEYQESVLPDSIPARISVEQGGVFGWSHYVGRHGKRIGMQTFGASAPLKELQTKFGFVADSIVEEAKSLIGR